MFKENFSTVLRISRIKKKISFVMPVNEFNIHK